jgi:hypothetical protein
MAAAIRPRGPAESFDLGFRMVRQWWRPVSGAWLLSVLPVYCLAAASIERWPAQTLLALWWLRPLFDRVPLFVLSRCLFGAPPSWRQTLRALPGLWWRQLAGALTWRRLDPWRSLHLPVRQLERLRGRERRARLHLLASGCRRQALGLTVGCLLLEAGAVVGLFGLLHMLLPQPERVWNAIFETSGAEPLWVMLIWLAAFFLGLSLVEPFYVGAGFALYLGQRTRFEGWDVEIALRRLAARLAAAAPSAPSAPSAIVRQAALAAVVLGLGLSSVSAVAGPARGPVAGPAGPTRAAAAKPAGGAPPVLPAALHRQVRTAVDEVLRAPEFETADQRIKWVPRSPGAKAEAERDWEWPWQKLPPMPRRAKRGLLAAAGAGALAYALLRLRRVWLQSAWRRPAAGGAGARPAASGAGAPQTVVGLDVRPESLPADVPAAAWQLWERGDAAAALGLLYRGSLAALMARTAIRFAASWTEGDCLSAVRRHAASEGDAAASGSGAAADLFARLTVSWQAAAYGRRETDGLVMRDLCSGWRRSFGDALGGAAPGSGAVGPGSGVAGPRGAA